MKKTYLKPGIVKYDVDVNCNLLSCSDEYVGPLRSKRDAIQDKEKTDESSSDDEDYFEDLDDSSDSMW